MSGSPSRRPWRSVAGGSSSIWASPAIPSYPAANPPPLATLRWGFGKGRSVSYENLCHRPVSSSSAVAAADGPAIARSRSDGSVDPGPLYNQLQLQPPQVRCHQRSTPLPVSSKPPLVVRARPASAGNVEVSDADGVVETAGKMVTTGMMMIRGT